MKKSKIKKVKKRILDNIDIKIINKSGSRSINFKLQVETVEEKEIVSVMVRDIKKAVKFCKYRLKSYRGELKRKKVKEFKGLDPIPKYLLPGSYGFECSRLIQDKTHTPVKMGGE